MLKTEPPPAAPGALTRRRRAVAGAIFLSTGAALVVYIISGVSLAAAGLVLLLIAAGVAIVVWRRATGSGRDELSRAVRVGLIAGVAATAAYDLTRYLVIEVFDFTIWPFDTFTLFGRALVGAGYTGWWVTLVGTLYHVANGIGFAIAYTVWFGRKGPLAGIAWAFVLEAFMLTLYPGWLNPSAIGEFVQMTVVGHVAYGATLGYLGRRLLLRSDARALVAADAR